MPQPTRSYFPPITSVVENTVHTMTEGILTTVKASIDVQQALVESTLSVIRAGFGANKLVIEQWLALGKHQQSSLLGVLENGVQTWASLAEQTVVAAEQVTEQAVDRVTAEAERVAEEAQAAGRQREQERMEPRRLEQQQRERADERQVVEQPVINVVKREDDWAVVRDNASRASATFDTKREAVERARELAQRSGGDLHIETVTSAPPEQQQQPEPAVDEREPAAPPAINVVKREDDWAVVRDNASRASATFDTKREAVERARELAQRSGADLHIETVTSAPPEQQQQPEPAVDEREPAAPPAINVVKREDDWAVVRDNARRPSGTFDTKREAVKRAHELAERSGAVVHVETAKGAQPERNGAG